MVRPLSKELQKIAIEELNENPERVEEDIKHLQEWIKKQPHLNAPTDKQWILVFLRGCKFSLQLAKHKFDMYYNFKNIMPELTHPDIHSIEIQALLKAGIILPLPYFENYKGPRVILMRFENCDASIMTVQNIEALHFMILNILMVEDDNFVINGVIWWYDLSCLPFSMILQLNPTFIKNGLYVFQNGFPIRIKGVHATGSFTLAEKVFNLIKGFIIIPKLKDRIFLHSEDNFENIYKSVPKSCMPKEYGGENSNLEEIKVYWANKVDKYSTWLAEDNKYFTNEAMRPGKPALPDDLVGVDGSFRKLNID